MLIGEVKCCGGNGWHLYDAAFCQQISSIEKLISQKQINHYIKSNCMLSDQQQGRDPGRERRQWKVSYKEIEKQ